ncbi:uncharacterized protein LOC135397649 [Ornithodoros turicata]|uniref:uncharacterized protein LOC135397649 n=1 Tax=Ornithodoros turicata TaxID=34597 RepID=UPI0031388CEA
MLARSAVRTRHVLVILLCRHTGLCTLPAPGASVNHVVHVTNVTWTQILWLTLTIGSKSYDEAPAVLAIRSQERSQKSSNAVLASNTEYSACGQAQNSTTCTNDCPFCTYNRSTEETSSASFIFCWNASNVTSHHLQSDDIYVTAAKERSQFNIERYFDVWNWHGVVNAHSGSMLALEFKTVFIVVEEFNGKDSTPLAVHYLTLFQKNACLSCSLNAYSNLTILVAQCHINDLVTPPPKCKIDPWMPTVGVCRWISLVCLLLKAVAFTLQRPKTFSSKCIMCLSTTMFVALVFLIISLNTQRASKYFSVAVQYVSLSTVTWMTILSYDIWYTIVSMRSGHSGSLLTYCVIGWGAAIPFAIGSMSFVKVSDACTLVQIYSPNMPTTLHGWVLFSVSFAGPYLALLFINCGLYIHIIFVLKTTAKNVEGSIAKAQRCRSQALLITKLALIMGVGQLVPSLINLFPTEGICCVITDMVRSLQGAYLFFGFRDYKHFVALCPSRTRTPTVHRCSRSHSSRCTVYSSTA